VVEQRGTSVVETTTPQGRSASTTCQCRQVTKSTLYKSKPLGAAPVLNLLLEGKRLRDALELMAPEEPDRQPASGVRRTFADLMLVQPMLQARRTSDVEGTVSAFKDVGVGHGPTMRRRGERLKAVVLACG
jgi:hypothetical protein